MPLDHSMIPWPIPRRLSSDFVVRIHLGAGLVGLAGLCVSYNSKCVQTNRVSIVSDRIALTPGLHRLWKVSSIELAPNLLWSRGLRTGSTVSSIFPVTCLRMCHLAEPFALPIPPSCTLPTPAVSFTFATAHSLFCSRATGLRRCRASMSPSSNILRSFDMLPQTHGVQAVPPTNSSLNITTDLDLQQQTNPLLHSILMGLVFGMHCTITDHPSGSCAA
jgi:hypothetical protein